jgi:hypothetical protein
MDPLHHQFVLLLIIPILGLLVAFLARGEDS